MKNSSPHHNVQGGLIGSFKTGSDYRSHRLRRRAPDLAIADDRISRKGYGKIPGQNEVTVLGESPHDRAG